MTPNDPGLARNQRQVIDLLIQHKQEWRRLYGIQELALFGSPVTFRKDVAGWRLFRPPAERVTHLWLSWHLAVH
jgi:hypothetical protein